MIGDQHDDQHRQDLDAWSEEWFRFWREYGIQALRAAEAKQNSRGVEVEKVDAR